MRKILWVVLILFTFSGCFFVESSKRGSNIHNSRNFPLDLTWSSCVGDDIINISTDYHKVVLVRMKNELVAFHNETGAKLWTASIGRQRDFFPAVIENEKVFATDENQLWSFDLITGEALWNTPLIETDTWIPDVSDEYVLVNSLSDQLYIYTALDGRNIWNTHAGRGFTYAFIEEEVVYVVDNGIIAYKVNDGKLLWKLDNSRATGVSAYSDSVLHFLEYPEDGTFDVVAYNTTLRKEQWRMNFSDIGPQGLYVTRKYLYLSARSDLYQLSRESGAINWMSELPNLTDLTLLDDYIYVLKGSQKTIRALRVEDGKEVGFLQVNSRSIFDTSNQGLISTNTGLVGYLGCEVFVYR